MSPLLISLLHEIECTDPRMNEFGDNAHEFTFINFAIPSFEDAELLPLTIENVSSIVNAWIDCLEENITIDSNRDGAVDFLETIQEFRDALSSADDREKSELIEHLFSELQSAMKEGE